MSIKNETRNGENYLNIIPTIDNVDYNRIYEYSDSELVKQFKTFHLNRKINNKRVSELANAYCDEKGYIPPIIVDINTLINGEGNHRRNGWLIASVSLRKNLQVIYVNCQSEKDLVDWIITINNKGKSWQTRDYYYSLLADNNPYVKAMNEFIHNPKHSLLLTKRGIPQIRYALAMFNVNEGSLKNRKIQFGCNAVDNAEIMYRDFEKMFNVLGWNSGPWIEYLLKVWYSIRIKKEDEIVYNRLDTIGIDYFISQMKYIEVVKDKEVVKGLVVEHNINPASKTKEWQSFFRDAIDELYFSKKLNKAA